MVYSNFKTINDVRAKFDLEITSGASLFANTTEIPISPLLAEILKENIPLALNINTEKARSELIIAPVLVEIRKLLHRQISLFSGIEFNVDEALGLSGYCDFILSNSPNQVFLESPIMCIVEAKNENIKTGYGQCIAEMIAAKLFNERKSIVVTNIFGIVTTGSSWRFLKYANDKVIVDFDEYLINQIAKINGIIVTTIKNTHSIANSLG